MEHKKLKFFSHISRLHNGFIFVPSFRGPPRGPGPRAPKLLKMALVSSILSSFRSPMPTTSAGRAHFLQNRGFLCYFCLSPRCSETPACPACDSSLRLASKPDFQRLRNFPINKLISAVAIVNYLTHTSLLDR